MSFPVRRRAESDSTYRRRVNRWVAYGDTMPPYWMLYLLAGSLALLGLGSLLMLYAALAGA